MLSLRQKLHLKNVAKAFLLGLPHSHFITDSLIGSKFVALDKKLKKGSLINFNVASFPQVLVALTPSLDLIVMSYGATLYIKLGSVLYFRVCVLYLHLLSWLGVYTSCFLTDNIWLMEVPCKPLAMISPFRFSVFLDIDRICFNLLILEVPHEKGFLDSRYYYT